MKAIKLFLPGKYDDALVYMGFMFVLTEDRELLVYDINSLVLQIEQRYTGLAVVLHNHLLGNTVEFRSLMHDEHKNLGSSGELDDTVEDIIQVNPRPSLVARQAVGLSDPMILDLIICNRRLYIGATGGLYHLDIETGENGRKVSIGRAYKQLDARCVGLSAYGGTIAASCGDGGLFALFDAFRGSHQVGTSPVLKLAEKSFTTAWLDGDLVNYPVDYSHPMLFQSQKEGSLVTGINKQGQELEYLLGHVQCQYPISEDHVRCVYNSHQHLYVGLNDGRFFCFPLLKDRDALSLGKGYQCLEDLGRILTICPCVFGAVLETTRGTVFVSGDGHSLSLVQDDVIQVRTFPLMSHQLSDVALVVHDDGIFLMNIFSELVSRPDRRNIS